MKLTLKNVRQHLDRVIEIPDVGIVKLSGKSGIGKSTILDSIRHVLLGDVDDMINWDQDHASITLQWHAIEVKRTMRPNTLTFTDADGTVTKDDLAQEEIFKWLAMNSEELLASSLIEQGMPSSLLTIKPAEQLRFIQRLAFGKDDPEVTKKRIAALVTARKTKLAISETSVATLFKRLEEAKTKVEYLEANAPLQIAKCRSVDEVAKIEASLQDANELARKLNRDIREARLALDNPVFTEMANLADRNRQYAETVRGLNQEIATAHNELAKLPPQEPEEVRQARQDARSAVKDGLEYLKILDEAKAKSAEIKAKFSLEGSPGDGLKTLLTTLMQENGELAAEHGRYHNELLRLRETPESQPCPECSTALMIDDGRIVKHSHEVSDLAERIIATEQAFEAVIVEKRRNQRARDAVTTAAGQLDALKGKLSGHKKPSFVSPEEAKSYLSKLEDETSAFKIQENLRGTLIAKIDTLGKMLENAVTKHEAYSTSVKERHSKAQPIETVKQKIATLETKLVVTVDEAETMTAVLASERENARINTEARVFAEKISAAHQALESADSQHLDADVQAKQDRTLLAAALRLKELSDKAALEAVDQIMAGINVNARHYIDSMFPDDGTIVELTNKKTLSDGEERAKPGIKVTHKGSNPKGIGSFSGGEKMRLALGFQLGMADMYKSPLLMVDEALAWLDLEAKERCLETLRPLAANKLILVIEHGLPDSMVDHVVSL